MAGKLLGRFNSYRHGIAIVQRCGHLNLLHARPESSLIQRTDVSSGVEPTSASLPMITTRELKHMHLVNAAISPPREAWVDNFDAVKPVKLGLVPLHPMIFAAFPRTDVIQENLKWQQTYRNVDWLTLKTRAELPGGGRKPWPQKGTGRARHGSIRSPIFMNGGWVRPPRGPKTSFYMLNFFLRVQGLTSTLSSKFAQDDLKIIDTLENFPSDSEEVLTQYIKERDWGPSVLFVDKSDFFPRNISLAAETIQSVNLMPVYGLNVYSMLRYETVVLTLDAVQEIEDKLLYQYIRTDLKNVIYKYEPPPVGEPQ